MLYQLSYPSAWLLYHTPHIFHPHPLNYKAPTFVVGLRRRRRGRGCLHEAWQVRFDILDSVLQIDELSLRRTCGPLHFAEICEQCIH